MVPGYPTSNKNNRNCFFDFPSENQNKNKNSVSGSSQNLDGKISFAEIARTAKFLDDMQADSLNGWGTANVNAFSDEARPFNGMLGSDKFAFSGQSQPSMYDLYHRSEPQMATGSGRQAAVQDNTIPTNLHGFHSLWMCNVSTQLTTTQLKRRFRVYGFITQIQINERGDSNKSNLVFVHFDNPESPVKAIAELQHYNQPDLCENPDKPLKIRLIPSNDQLRTNPNMTMEQARRVCESHNECFNWRIVSGCRQSGQCRWRHIIVNREIDSQPWVRFPLENRHKLTFSYLTGQEHAKTAKRIVWLTQPILAKQFLLGPSWSID